MALVVAEYALALALALALASEAHHIQIRKEFGCRGRKNIEMSSGADGSIEYQKALLHVMGTTRRDAVQQIRNGGTFNSVWVVEVR